MNRFDRNLIILIAGVLVVGLSIAALIGHYATTPPPPPLRQVPNAHIATAFGHGPTPHEIQDIVDLRAALAWRSGEVERLTKELAECQRKEAANVQGQGEHHRIQATPLSNLRTNSQHTYQNLSAVRNLKITDRQTAPTGGDANVRGVVPSSRVIQPPVQTAPGGGRTKEETWMKNKQSSPITRPDVSNHDVRANALAKIQSAQRESSAGTVSTTSTSTTTITPSLRQTERPSALALTRSGKPSWSTPLNDFRGDWDAPPVPQPVVSPRMMAVMAIRRPSNPPELALPVLCDDADVHGRWGTEYFSQFPNHEYLADKCWLIHAWKHDGGDLHVFLALHGYPSPGAAYDLHVPWEAYAGAHWLGVCTTLSGCGWIPVDGNDRRGVTVQAPMDLPFEQPAILRSARGAMVGGNP